jgi:hypothetical protein
VFNADGGLLAASLDRQTAITKAIEYARMFPGAAQMPFTVTRQAEREIVGYVTTLEAMPLRGTVHGKGKVNGPVRS